MLEVPLRYSGEEARVEFGVSRYRPSSQCQEFFGGVSNILTNASEIRIRYYFADRVIFGINITFTDPDGGVISIGAEESDQVWACRCGGGLRLRQNKFEVLQIVFEICRYFQPSLSLIRIIPGILRKGE